MDDVRINNLESNLHMTDARAMLTPEVRAQIVAEVLRALQEEQRQAQERARDMAIDKRAAELDPW